MTIEVRCPNGHLLACPDDRAGKQGKCPKCGTMFKVPAVNGSVPAPTVETARRTPPDPAEAPSDKAVPGKTQTKHIVFLCPNGHKLNGPASLQGQPGQCPHCGAKFRIPVYAAADEIEGEPDDDGESTHIGEAGSFDLELEDATPNIAEEEEFEEELETVEEFAAEDDPFPARRAAGGDPFFSALEQTPDTIHPMAKLFATLWNERVHGGIIEINLEDGVTLVPDWWAQRLSLEAYGVFATQTADGSYVMEAVAWDHVKRVTVRRITELPDGVFE